MRYQFTSKQRLTSNSQIKQVFANAKRISLSGIAVFVVANSLNYARLNVIIAKRNVARAVERNRIKRVIRESFRLNQHLLARKDIIVIGYKGIEKKSNEELFKCLEKIWRKLD